MSQFPPPQSPVGYAPPGMYPQQRTSAAAVTSLIFGILGCLVVTGLIAVITGIIGISATKNPAVKGRGMAIAGLILGLVGMVGGGLCIGFGGYAGVMAYKEMKPAYESATGLVEAASAGDIDKAMKFVDTTKVSKEQLGDIINDLKTLGKFKEIKPGINNNVDLSAGIVDFQGTVVFANGQTRKMDVSLRKQADGTYRITSLNVVK